MVFFAGKVEELERQIKEAKQQETAALTSQKEMASLMSTQQQKFDSQLKKMQEQLSDARAKMVPIAKTFLFGW